MTGRLRRTGFTLLEVMVALAVMAASMMAVADLSGSALKNYVYARDMTVATMLARGKMAELAEKYEDLGFTDFDQVEDGTFSDQGEPGFRWKLELRKPAAELTAESLISALLGGGNDSGTQDVVAKLLGGSGAPGGGSGPTSGAPGGLLGGLLQNQVKALAEEIKKGVRKVNLRISWKDGKTENGFDLATYWVVLNPRAPGGSRGADPDIPPNLAMPAAASRLPGVGTPITGTGGATGTTGTTGTTGKTTGGTK